MNWLNEFYELAKINKNDLGMDLLFDNVDEMLCDGKFKEVDDLLETMDLSILNTTLLIGLLSITSAAKNKLKNRASLVQRIEEIFKVTDPERVDRLLKGLR
jgi:hypothetical protein